MGSSVMARSASVFGAGFVATAAAVGLGITMVSAIPPLANALATLPELVRAGFAYFGYDVAGSVFLHSVISAAGGLAAAWYFGRHKP